MPAVKILIRKLQRQNQVLYWAAKGW